MSALLATLLCGAAGTNGEPAQVLPSESRRGLWIVPLSVGDDPGETVELILDTGAEPTSMDPEALARLVGSPVESGKVYRLSEARIGDFAVGEIRVGACDLDHLEVALGRSVDGILGFPVFRDVLLTLNYESGQVGVSRGRMPPPDGREIFRDVGGKRPMLRVEVGGKREKILIDSGSTGGFDLAPDERLEWRAEPRSVSASVRFARIEINEAGRMAGRLRFGPGVFEEPIVERAERLSLAGYKVLRNFVWTFDARSKRMRIEPLTPAPIRMEAQRGLGVAFRPRDGELEVVGVLPGASEALREGDVITHQEGVPIRERGCAAPEDDPERAAVRLTVRRGEAIREIDVGIATLVP